MKRPASRMRIGIVFLMVLFTAGLSNATDLGERYPATLDFSPDSRSYDWECEAADAWRLKEFQVTLPDVFQIEVGAAQVVFGRHASNVLWAAVFPQAPGKIVKASSGQGERVTSIWLRFHPAMVSDLFPAATVLAAGDAKLLDRAEAMAAHKLSSSWQSRGRPMIPSKPTIIVDLETVEGARRFYAIDTSKHTADYYDAFRTRPLPTGKPLADGSAVAIFDKIWNAFDREYAMFVVKPKVDWQALRDQYRPLAASAQNTRALARVISRMLTHLEDLHIYVQVEGDFVPGYNRSRMLNANHEAVEGLVGPLKDRGSNIEWARSQDGIGYINIYGLGDETLPDKFQSHLQRMERTRGLVIDLRFNGGGSEMLAQQIAGHFVDRERVYAKNQYRNGPKHDDLGPQYERSFKPSQQWYYAGPVVVLQGQTTMSSAEAFVLMMKQCLRVTTMGDRTAGSSGNPRRIEAGAGIVVNLPRWLPLDAEGNSLDAVGVPPDLLIKAAPSDFSNMRDPVLAAALRRLREGTEIRTDSSPPVLVPRPGRDLPRAED